MFVLREMFSDPTLEAATPDDLEAFDAHARAITARFAVAAAVFMLAFTLAWWPLDAWVMPDISHREGFARLRVRAAAVELVTLLALVSMPVVRRHALVLAPLSYAALLGSFGASLGQIPNGEVSLLADAFIGIVPLSLLPVAWPRRLFWTLTITASLLVAYFAATPPGVVRVGAATQVSFSGFAVLLTVSVGELAFRLTRIAFLRERALQRTMGQLEALAGSLSDTVSERTRELRALATHLSGVQESERRSIARDLHDDLGQSLTAMRYSLARLERRIPSDADGAHELFDDVSALLDGTFSTVRGFVTQLRPVILDDLGFVAAAEWFTNRMRTTAEIEVEYEASADAIATSNQLAPEQSLVLFRVLQEASTNALRHGRPSRIEVTVESDADTVRLRVADDGRGFDAGAATLGMGLLGLRERVHAMDGKLDVAATVGAGTVVTAILPRATSKGLATAT